MRMPKFWCAVLLLLAAGLVLHVRGDQDRVPHSEPLTSLPYSIGAWQGSDQPLAAYVFDVLGKGFFLNRAYSVSTPTGPSGPMQTGTAPIGLFIGYFPTQRTGQAIHSPLNCLPGAGWTFDSHRIVTLPDQHGGRYEVGDYLITNGSDRDEVLYWYRSQGRTIASDYKAKWYTLIDSILYGRTDAALVRVITPIQPGESRAVAQARVIGFASQLNPLLPRFVPN